MKSLCIYTKESFIELNSKYCHLLHHGMIALLNNINKRYNQADVNVITYIRRRLRHKILIVYVSFWHCLLYKIITLHRSL